MRCTVFCEDGKSWEYLKRRHSQAADCNRYRVLSCNLKSLGSTMTRCIMIQHRSHFSYFLLWSFSGSHISPCATSTSNKSAHCLQGIYIDLLGIEDGIIENRSAPKPPSNSDEYQVTDCTACRNFEPSPGISECTYKVFGGVVTWEQHGQSIEQQGKRMG